LYDPVLAMSLFISSPCGANPLSKILLVVAEGNQIGMIIQNMHLQQLFESAVYILHKCDEISCETCES